MKTTTSDNWKEAINRFGKTSNDIIAGKGRSLALIHKIWEKTWGTKERTFNRPHLMYLSQISAELGRNPQKPKTILLWNMWQSARSTPNKEIHKIFKSLNFSFNQKFLCTLTFVFLFF